MGEAKHSRVKSIPCPHCQKMFSRKGHMTEHVRTVHEGKKRIYKEVKSDTYLDLVIFDAEYFTSR